jgi:hypothetical protein
MPNKLLSQLLGKRYVENSIRTLTDPPLGQGSFSGYLSSHRMPDLSASAVLRVEASSILVLEARWLSRDSRC